MFHKSGWAVLSAWTSVGEKSPEKNTTMKKATVLLYPPLYCFLQNSDINCKNWKYCSKRDNSTCLISLVVSVLFFW